MIIYIVIFTLLKTYTCNFSLVEGCCPRLTYTIAWVSFHYFSLYLEFEDFFLWRHKHLSIFIYCSMKVRLSDDWHSKLHLRLFSEVETEFCKSKSPLYSQGSQCRKALPNVSSDCLKEVSTQNSFFNEFLSRFLCTGHGLTSGG